MSVATMNIILLLFTWSQFTAISFPHKHRVLVTKKRVLASVILTWLYTIAFAALSASGVAHSVLFKIDLYFHTTGSLLPLMTAYFCLYKAFRRQMRRLQTVWENSNAVEEQIEEKGNLLLSIFYC